MAFVDWLSVALETAKWGLQLAATNSAKEHGDKIYEAEMAYYAEDKKGRPNHALLDELEHKLFELCRTASSAAKAGGPQAPPQDG